MDATRCNEQSPAIEVKDLARRFGSINALDGVSFTVERGQVVGFIGANGAGKTTTMRILATLETLDRGSVRVFGYDVESQPEEVQKRLGWMPDAFGSYKHMVVAEYLDFFARACGLKGDVRRRRMQEVSEFTELDRISGHMVATLSKGQSQRLSLARTLLNDPDLLVLDEPAAGLDPKARVELKRLIRLLAKRGKTLFVSSHILSELDEVCDSLLFIDAGRIVYQGGADALKEERTDRMLVEVELAGPTDALMAWFETHPTIEVERQEKGRVYVHVIGELDLREQVLKQLIDDGFPVIGFKRVERKLEDAFIQRLQAEAKA